MTTDDYPLANFIPSSTNHEAPRFSRRYGVSFGYVWQVRNFAYCRSKIWTAVTHYCMVCQDECWPSDYNVSRMLQHALCFGLPVASTLMLPQYFGRLPAEYRVNSRQLRPCMVKISSMLHLTKPVGIMGCGLIVPLL